MQSLKMFLDFFSQKVNVKRLQEEKSCNNGSEERDEGKGLSNTYKRTFISFSLLKQFFHLSSVYL